MKKRVLKGPIRDKEKTMEKLLKAVGEILTIHGFSALKVNDLAKFSGVNKRLIYEYFGSMDNLVDSYIKQQDYWNVLKKIEIPKGDDNGELLVKGILKGQFDEMGSNKELQKIMLWDLSEKREVLKQQVDEREANGEQIFQNLLDPFFKEKSKFFRAITALIISGSYYLNMSKEANGTYFCGLDINSENDRKEIKDAIDFMIEKAYQEKKNKIL